MHYVMTKELELSVKGSLTDAWALTDAWLEVFAKKTPYYQDGCRRITYINGRNNAPVSKIGIERVHKQIADGKIPMSPDKYQCKVYDCGIVGWVSKRKRNKIVNHKVTEVIEQRTYHSKPKSGLKGGWIEELHHVIVRYSGRCYDKYEHGGFAGDCDGWNELY